jgi:hypothetical protein
MPESCAARDFRGRLRTGAISEEAGRGLADDFGVAADAGGVAVRVAGRPALLVAGPRLVDPEEALDTSGDPVSADAVATPDQTATPTPRATARPPTRPTYRAASIADPNPFV